MKYYTIAQAANIVGVSRVTLYNWIHSGRIQCITIDGENNTVSYAVPSTEVDKFASAGNIVEKAIKRTFKEYGDVLDQLADE
jgi:excisionase family DNA binding protein